MKKYLAAFLTFCMIAGLATPAGEGVFTKISANTEAALHNMAGESTSAKKGSFDSAISELYDNSMSATDEEVLASAEKMESDFAVIEDSLGGKAKGLIDVIKSYEAVKSRYIADQEADEEDVDVNIVEEWKKQGEYTSYVMPASDEIRTLVPRIKVTSCNVDNKTATLDVYEWMTVGYAPEDVQELSAAAYGYNFSMKAECDHSGNWEIAAVGNTEQNFVWMEEEAEYASEAEKADIDDRRVVSEDGSQEMMAASAAASYTYNVSKAIAYADKYCINYNSSYNSYKGRGGDCANFVSQCLYAGGFKQDSVWYKHSVAWINVMKQIAHFKPYGKFLTANNSNLIKGNPIYFDWNGDGVYDHATICAGRNSSGVAILDSHTKDLYHATWTNWSFKKAATIQLRGSGSSSSTSDGKFKTDDNGKYFQYSDGTILKSCFQKIDGKTYYFKSNGYVAKGLTKISGKTYLFNTSTGVMYTGWVTYKGNKYYFGSNGAAYTEWEEIGGKEYYFNPTTCVMAKGFYRVKTKLHYFDSNGVEQFGWITVSGKKYHLDEYGVVQFGWHSFGGKKYYFDTNGAMVTGNVSIDGELHQFDKNGIYKKKLGSGTTADIVVNTKTNKTTYANAAKTTTAQAPKKNGKTGWVKKNGNWYYYKKGVMQKGWLKLGKSKKRVFYLGSNGVMRTGWKTINGSKYYFNSEGVMKTGWFKYKSAWYYLKSNGKMKTGWLKLKGRYFFLQKNGKMKTGWHDDADGNTYYLNSEGVMLTGRQTIKGRTYYFDEMGALQD